MMRIFFTSEPDATAGAKNQILVIFTMWYSIRSVSRMPSTILEISFTCLYSTSWSTTEKDWDQTHSLFFSMIFNMQVLEFAKYHSRMIFIPDFF